MRRLDVDGLPPTTHADDDVADDDVADEILAQAPELEDRFITIPNVL